MTADMTNSSVDGDDFSAFQTTPSALRLAIVGVVVAVVVGWAATVALFHFGEGTAAWVVLGLTAVQSLMLTAMVASTARVISVA